MLTNVNVLFWVKVNGIKVLLHVAICYHVWSWWMGAPGGKDPSLFIFVPSGSATKPYF